MSFPKQIPNVKVFANLGGHEKQSINIPDCVVVASHQFLRLDRYIIEDNLGGQAPVVVFTNKHGVRGKMGIGACKLVIWLDFFGWVQGTKCNFKNAK